ncbi:MAG: sodium/proton-translocating pyrophosphatase, partial [Fimbriimonadaceae bacterium]|nr:sodium/proton-translocating pyrophosphatase [Fimbriimonadaceae bacterium]
MIARLFGGSKRQITILLTALIAMLLPSLAIASGGENVTLQFSQSDFYYLYASLAFGLIAIVTAFAIRSKVLGQGRGDESMQEVGRAIKDGALAYLRQQVSTMAVFVVILAIGLFFLYTGRYGNSLAMWVAICFVLGVGASYMAGYIGMIMAVEANTRTAAAALTSYKKSLETAFQAGAVAGLITVGLGLIGATAIFLAFPSDAMKLLIGFGFGGSLAALFMRVGGGIYTKAADVGADLVGKVEAGIPEDDPRNPAVIADNVGDNVGDCAGMAADVFESYEVTLVAAIVLGAATAAIFDTSTWMKLVMFALMARGVGIIASIFGIFMVKGSEDINADPLKAIKRGFTSSALIAVVLTAGLAYYMLGGMSNKDAIRSQNFVTSEGLQYEAVMAFVGAQSRIAAEKKVAVKDVTAADITADA